MSLSILEKDRKYLSYYLIFNEITNKLIKI